MAEILYPRDLIRRTYRAIREYVEPDNIDLAIELIDVKRALNKMPDQYYQALLAWYETDGDPEEMAMYLHSSPAIASSTVKLAWDYLYRLLNG